MQRILSFIFVFLTFSSVYACEVGDTSCGYWGDDNGTCTSTGGGYYSCTCTPTYSWYVCLSPGEVEESSYSDEFDFTCPSEAGPNTTLPGAPVLYCMVEDQGGAGVTVHRIGTLRWMTGECPGGIYDECPEECAVPLNATVIDSETCAFECNDGYTAVTNLDGNLECVSECGTGGFDSNGDCLCPPTNLEDIEPPFTCSQDPPPELCFNDEEYTYQEGARLSGSYYCDLAPPPPPNELDCPEGQATDGVYSFCFPCDSVDPATGVCTDIVTCGEHQIRVSADECYSCPVVSDNPNIRTMIDFEHNKCVTFWPTYSFDEPPALVPPGCIRVDSTGEVKCSYDSDYIDSFCGSNPDLCSLYNVGGCGIYEVPVPGTNKCVCKEEHCVFGESDYTCWNVVETTSGECEIDTDKDGSGDALEPPDTGCPAGTVEFNGKCLPDENGDGQPDGGEVKQGDDVVTDLLNQIKQGQCGGPGQPVCKVQDDPLKKSVDAIKDALTGTGTGSYQPKYTSTVSEPTGSSIWNDVSSSSEFQTATGNLRAAYTSVLSEARNFIQVDGAGEGSLPCLNDPVELSFLGFTLPAICLGGYEEFFDILKRAIAVFVTVVCAFIILGGVRNAS